MIDLPQYRLVWNEEFDGNTIDRDRWSYISCQSSGPDQAFCDDRIEAKDGCAVLSVTYDPADTEKPYRCPWSLVTADSMNFRYGYVEVRAKMPYLGKGEWPAIWYLPNLAHLNREVKARVSPDANVEIDQFESFSSLGDAMPQLHFWFSDLEKRRVNILSDPERVFHFPDAETANDFHLYGMLWTEDTLSFYMDDVCHYTYTVPQEDRELMSAYQAFILSLQYFSPAYVAKGWGTEGTFFKENPDGKLSMAVDYVRLYQNPETDSIVTK